MQRVMFNMISIMDKIRRAQAHAIDPTRQALMQAAATRGKVRPSELARELNIGQSSVTRQVRRLEDDGYVVVEPDPTDGRSCLVSLSEAGHAEAVRLTRLGMSRMMMLFEDWDGAEVGRLGDLLGAMDESWRVARERQERGTGRRWQQGTS